MPSLRHMPPAHIEPRIAPKLVNAMARCGWHFCGRQLFFFGMGPSLLLFMIGLGMVDSLIPVIMLVLDYIRLLDVIKLWVFIYRGLVVPCQFIYSIYTSNIVTSRYNFFNKPVQWRMPHTQKWWVARMGHLAHRNTHIEVLTLSNSNLQKARGPNGGQKWRWEKVMAVNYPPENYPYRIRLPRSQW